MGKFRNLVVFDFDQTILASNVDYDVLNIKHSSMPESRLRAGRAQGECWTVVMQSVFDLHLENDITVQDYHDKLDSLTLNNGMKECIESLNSELDSEVIVLSDANSVFIERILLNHGLRKHFTHVFTNPAKFHTNPDRLTISPFHKNDWCPLSGPNLCKGRVLSDFLATREFEHVGYVGDGGNDFCPMLGLNHGDLALPRKGFAIEKVIEKRRKEGLFIKADTVFWQDGFEVFQALKKHFSSLK